jgi:hypothetical protein
MTSPPIFVVASCLSTWQHRKLCSTPPFKSDTKTLQLLSLRLVRSRFLPLKSLMQCRWDSPNTAISSLKQSGTVKGGCGRSPKLPSQITCLFRVSLIPQSPSGESPVPNLNVKSINIKWNVGIGPKAPLCRWVDCFHAVGIICRVSCKSSITLAKLLSLTPFDLPDSTTNWSLHVAAHRN